MGFSVCVRTALSPATVHSRLRFGASSVTGYGSSGCAQGVQPGDVVGQRGQGEFVGYFVQSTGAKLSDSTLLFEDTEDRFDYRLAPRVGGLSGRTSQLGAHAAMSRGTGPSAARSAQIQSPRHIRVRYISIDVALFHVVEVIDREESAVGKSRIGRRPTSLFHLIDHGLERVIIGHV